MADVRLASRERPRTALEARGATCSRQRAVRRMPGAPPASGRHSSRLVRLAAHRAAPHFALRLSETEPKCSDGPNAHGWGSRGLLRSRPRHQQGSVGVGLQALDVGDGHGGDLSASLATGAIADPANSAAKIGSSRLCPEASSLEPNAHGRTNRLLKARQSWLLTDSQDVACPPTTTKQTNASRPPVHPSSQSIPFPPSIHALQSRVTRPGPLQSKRTRWPSGPLTLVAESGEQCGAAR